MTNMTITEPPASPAPAKRNSAKIIIPIIIVLILLCICLVIAGVIAWRGTQGKGLLKMLATATNTPIPTRTFTPTPQLSMEGDWTISFSWDCTADYATVPATFFSDGTYWANEDSSLWGTWFMVGDSVDFTFDEYPNTHYVGYMASDGAYMEGTMDNLDGMTGCWYAYYGIAPAPAGASLAGDWTVYFSWDCTSDYNNTLFTFYDDSSFYTDPYVGSWYTSGDYVEFQITDYPSTTYVGTLDGSGTYMDGTMSNLDGMSGCWYAIR